MFQLSCPRLQGCQNSGAVEYNVLTRPGISISELGPKLSEISASLEDSAWPGTVETYSRSVEGYGVESKLKYKRRAEFRICRLLLEDHNTMGDILTRYVGPS
jgi:hypothetical protein